MTRLMKKRVRKTTKSIHATSITVPAMPVKPNRPAMSAIIRKVTVQLNIGLPSFLKGLQLSKGSNGYASPQA